MHFKDEFNNSAHKMMVAGLEMLTDLGGKIMVEELMLMGKARRAENLIHFHREVIGN